MFHQVSRSCHFGLLMLLSASAYGHPPAPNSVEHSHAEADIKWELDSEPVRDGDSAHNHFTNQWFGLGLVDEEVPFDVFSCWDNQYYRFSQQQAYEVLDFAHCFINKNSIISGQVPTYRFVGSNWPAAAKDRVRDAFVEWSSVTSLAVRVGAQFVEASSGAGHVSVRYVSQLPGLPPPGSTGYWDPHARTLYFKDIPNWNFAKSPSGIPGSHQHFYSVALHEVGHAFGFDHTGNTDSIMYIDPDHDIGAPKDDGGRHFDELDDVDKIAVKNVYGIPNPVVAAAPMCEVVFYGCNEQNKEMVFVSFDTPGFGYPATNFVTQKQLFGGSWTTVGNLPAPGCVSQAVGIGTSIFRVLMYSLLGTTECQVIYFSDGEYCSRHGF